MSLRSPFADPAGWQYGSEPLTLPPAVRYAGYAARALHAQRAGGVPAAAVQAPAASAVRRTSIAPAGPDPGVEVVELTPLAFRFPELARRIAPGVPTLYLLLPAGATVMPLDHDLVAFGEVIATVSEARWAAVFPDRLPREPAQCAALLLQAINDAGEDNSEWQPFAAAVTAQTANGSDAPVLLLDHAGRPLTAGALDVTVDGAAHAIALAPEDHGDLQSAISRLHAADPAAMPLADLWGGGAASASISPAGGDVQLARLEDGLAGAGAIAVNPGQRHVMLTDLHRWFAPQFAIPEGEAAPPLARYTRGNRLTPLVNGVATFDDMFRTLDEVRASGAGAFHLAGWSLFAEEALTQAPPGAAGDFPLTVAEAAALIGAAGGASRFLAVDFVQVSDPAKLQAIETVALYLFFAGEVIARIPASSAPRDGTGLLLAFAVLVANAFIVAHLASDDFKQLEANQPAVDVLHAVNNSAAFLSPLPFTVDDNPLADIDNILYGAGEPLFDAIRHFGVYHQKLAVMRRDAGFIGYCGGIDFNPNRVDDERHLALGPYHDVHARLEGPAVRDLVITFDQRWERDGAGVALTFDEDDANAIPDVGGDVVQVARTYGASSADARKLSFAPDGDRTLLDTILKAIGEAREFIYIEDQYLTPPREYVDALIDRIHSGELRKLIIVIPNLTDQPFGEIRRTDVIDDLRAAAAAAGNPDMVRVGSPRRHFTVPASSLRSSSGRVFVKHDIISPLTGATAIALGPPARLPEVPFWIAVEGELIWVYDESTLPNPNPENMKIFQIERGDDTRILSGVPPFKGTTAREHKAGAAATLVNLDGIYVHAKLMIVDDVFLSVGSANLNRRGFYFDGECNLFTVPQSLRAGADNPVRALRKQLWAEMLDLPLTVADPLLEDPVASSTLFDRSWFLGNRFVRAEAYPTHLMIRNFAGGDGIVFALLNHLGFALLTGSTQPLFDTVIDPSSPLDPDAP